MHAAIRRERHFGDRVVRCYSQRPASLGAMLRAAAARRPDAEALIVGARRLLWRELLALSTQLADSLQALGVTRGDRVALLLGNGEEFVLASLAVIDLGAILVPIGIREGLPGVRSIVDHSQARVLIAHAGVLAGLCSASEAGRPVPDAPWSRDEAGSALPDAPWSRREAGNAVHARDSAVLGSQGLRAQCGSCLEHLIVAGAAPGTLVSPALSWEHLLAHDAPGVSRSYLAFGGRAQVDEEDVVAILYTSGTTGLPKGAMLTHLNILHSVLHYAHAFGLDSSVRAGVAVPMSHVTGLVALMATGLGVGGCIIVWAQFQAAGFLRLAARERMSFTIMVPAMYKLCLLEPALHTLDLGCWTVGGYGGAPMPPDTIAALAEALPALRLSNCYGATETASPVTVMPAERTGSRPDSVGVPLPCAEVAVMDEAGRELPFGEVGELWLKGPMVVPGYWRNSEASREAFVGGYWRSGDAGTIDAEGFVILLDRYKDMLNRGGYKVYSVEVEHTLCTHPAVLEAAVVARPCPVLGERVHAFVCLRPGMPAEGEDLRAYCTRHLADYKVPESITLRDAPLPRNANGKILKRELRALLQT